MRRNLIATVGSNPLPVVIVARHLQPPKLWLLHTESTQKVCQQVRDLLMKDDGKPEIVAVEMGEGLSLHEASDKLREVNNKLGSNKIEWVGSNLNYTAGTKQMAVVVHQLWKESNSPNGGEADACYLSPDGCLFWDNGEKERPEVSLSLEEVATLHFDEKSKTSNDHEDEHKLNLSHRIQNAVRKTGINSYLAAFPPVYGKGQIGVQDAEIFVSTYNAGDEKNFKDTSPWMTKTWVLEALLGAEPLTWNEVTQRVFQSVKANKSDRLKAFKFLATEWLEIWLADFLVQTGLFDEVAHSFQIDPGGPKDFELDVVALKGPRIFTFSCTVDQSKGLVKSKALEAHHRTQRIGGDHAAYAVFSLSDKPSQVYETIMEERWHGYDRARIFGTEHLRDTEKFREELTKWVQR